MTHEAEMIEKSETRDSHQVVMPKLGLTMTEATIVEWLKKDGDQVEKGERLFVLESEKSTLEIEAPASGRLQILVAAGKTVPVHQPIGLLLKGTAQRSRPPSIPRAGTAAIDDAPPVGHFAGGHRW
jgi:pyruvate/2-oxoglutarate dehydrogenase complex dihydrolipoamide acyltransferase (E2) component